MPTPSPAAPLPCPPLPAALLCDMDGTLVDTEHAWLATVAGVLGAHGSGAADVTPFAGLAIPDAVALLARACRLTPREGAAAEERLRREFTERLTAGVTVQPGALDLLDRARALGVPVALVTASERPVADLVLRTLGEHRFAYSVTSGETPRDKPHPEPYLTAARGLGVEPADCLAVEDTPTGAAAALAAGCRVLAVPTVPGIDGDHPRVRLVRSLEGVDPAALWAARP